MIKIDKDSELYPKRLIESEIYTELYVMGDATILNKDSIAVIGSRKSTKYGENITKNIVADLIKEGLCIVSGMAIGIDTIAHYSSIKNGGKTIAVLGAGFNNIYPEENIDLYNLILKTGGAIISEYPPNEKIKKSNFPVRNRIVSGLTLGTLVIEATYRSGTSITAHYAMQQKKPVFCIPNSLENINSSGTINLVMKGAKLIKNADNIVKKLPKLNNKIEVINIEESMQNNEKKLLDNIKQRIDSKVVTRVSRQIYVSKIDNVQKTKKQVNINEQFDPNKKILKEKGNAKEILAQLNESENKVYQCIESNPKIEANQIAKILKLSIKNVNCCLTILEIEGIIIETEGNKFIVNI